MGQPQPGAGAYRRDIPVRAALAASEGRRQRDPGAHLRPPRRLRGPRRLSGRSGRHHERRKAEARIAYMAHHDGLTNLPNRELYQERLKQALEAAQSTGKRVAVLGLDLDLFKNVNDSFGHPIGDRLLQQVADRLRAQVRGGNLAARLGGDEFAVILASDVSPKEISRSEEHTS